MGSSPPHSRKKHMKKELAWGVYDIHSPRVPTVEEMVDMIEWGIKVLDKDQFWINPDCGLKTRGIPETVASLKNMVEAAKTVRENLLVNQQAND